MRLQRHESHQSVPWRNGGGLTREIALRRAVHPPGDILWRVSAATVSAPGPFSRFDGIDRSIAVMDGMGLVLRSGDTTVTLTTTSAPYSFAGEEDIRAHNVGGPTIDLNVMTKRGQFTHAMSRLVVEAPVTILARADVTILVAGDDLRIALDETTLTARQGDAVLDIATGDAPTLSSEQRAVAYLIEIFSCDTD